MPKWYQPKPCPGKGTTQIVSNDRGHLLPGIPHSKRSPWGEFVGTWSLPKKITRKIGMFLRQLGVSFLFIEII